MKSQLKIIGPIVLIVIVVFGVTILSQYSPDTSRNTTNDAIIGQPLTFRITELKFDPSSSDIEKRVFDGFYETQANPIAFSFWCRNPHPVPVKLWAVGRSCTSCTAVQVAVVPTEKLKFFDDPAGLPFLAGFFPGLNAGVPNLLAMLPAVNTVGPTALEFKELDFGNPASFIEIPAATDTDTPMHAIIQMYIKIGDIGQRERSVGLAASAAEQPPSLFELKTYFVGTPPFAVSPTSINLGNLPENAAPQRRTIYYWSATRPTPESGLEGALTLPPPKLTLTDHDGFLTVGDAVPLTADERKHFETELLNEGTLVRVKGAYRLEMTYHRTLPIETGPAKEPDIGPFDLRISFAGPNSSSAVVDVTGTVTGVVAIDRETAIKLGTYSGRTGTTKTVNLVSDRDDLELRVLTDQHSPSYFKVTLDPPTREGGRRYWPLKVQVPAGASIGPLRKGSYVALQAKTGDRTLKVRLPIEGFATNQ